MRSFILSLTLGLAALAGTLFTPSSVNAQPWRWSQPAYYYNTYSYPTYSYYYTPGTTTYSTPGVSYYYDPSVSTYVAPAYVAPATTYVAPATSYYYTPGYSSYYYYPTYRYRYWR